jgi:hypothetical protein
MSSRVLTCLFAATALFSGGCDDATGLPSGQAANVRIVNASPVVGELDVRVGGTEQTNASNLAFRAASAQCVRVDADNPQLELLQTGGSVTIPPPTFSFDNGGRNTVVVAGTSAGTLRVLTFSEPLTPLNPGRARIRVVNGRATTAMNVTVTPWDAPPDPAPTPTTIAASADPAAAATTWIEVPSDEAIAVRLTTAAGADIDVLNVFPTSGQELILVAVDPPTGQAGVQWAATTACSRP